MSPDESRRARRQVGDFSSRSRHPGLHPAARDAGRLSPRAAPLRRRRPVGGVVIGGKPARIDETDADVFVDHIADVIEIPTLKWL
jgi:hypothetical protein